jgi:hypothetical protein
VNPLRGCFLKVERSLKHLEALNEARHIWFQPDDGGFLIAAHANSQKTKYLLRAKLTRPIPSLEWGVYIGDAVHCLRSALDQMVYALAFDPEPSAAYPICLTHKEWVIDAPRLLWSVDRRVSAVIEQSQPYHRGDAAHAHPLAMLRTLWNLDKHRTIPNAALLPTEVDLNVVDTEGIASYGKPRVNRKALLEEDAILVEIPFKIDESGVEPKMNMNPHFTFDVAFGRAPIPSALHRKPVVQAFNEELGSYVLGILGTASVLLGYAEQFTPDEIASMFPQGIPEID